MKIGKGRWIGYIKGQGGTESWCAIWRESDGKLKQETVAALTELPYEIALDAVQKIHARVALGIARKTTVWEICEAYIQNTKTVKGLRGRKGEYCAAGIERQLKREVHDRKIGAREIGSMRLLDFETWRDELLAGGKRKPGTANRIIRSLKAALNYGLKKQMAESDRSWKFLSAFPSPDHQRETFLTPKQRATLLAAGTPDVRRFLTALLLTGARPGEMAQTKVSDLDLKTRTLRLKHNKGLGNYTRTRDFPISNEHDYAFFKGLTKDKLPGAYLLTKDDGSHWDSKNQAQSFANSMRWCIGQIRKRVERNEEMTDVEFEAAKEEAMPIETVAYTMRHTAISEWLTQGQDAASVAYVAGTSIQMIDKHYRKFIRRNFEERLKNFSMVF